MIPTPPLTEDGALAVDVASIVDAVVPGCVATCCVCAVSVASWWRMPDGAYVPIHTPRFRNCVERMVDGWRDRLTGGAPVTAQSGVLQGAYARRARASGRPVVVARPVSRSGGSRFFRPGMPDGAPWATVTETHDGRLVSVSDNEKAARSVFARYRSLASKELPVRQDGLFAVGGVLIDPGDREVERWGEPFDVDGPPRWPHMLRVGERWTTCVGCGAAMWPLRLVSTTGRCRRCVALDEEDDPRRWLAEPAEPAVEFRPPEFGGPRRPKSSKNRDGA